MKAKALIPTLAVALLLAGAATAQAGSGHTATARATWRSAPRLTTGDLTGFVCTTRIHGRAGLGTTNDPAVTPPPRATVLAADRAGVHRGAGRPRRRAGRARRPAPAERQDDHADRGHQHHAAPTTLKPPEQYFGLTPDNPIWEYASAPFAFSFAPGQIAASNDIVCRPGRPLRLRARNVAQACPNQRSLEWPGLEHGTQGNVTSVAQTVWKKLAVHARHGRHQPTCRAPTTRTARSPERSRRRCTTPSTHGPQRTACALDCSSTIPTMPSPSGFGHGRADELRRVRRRRAPGRSTSRTAPTRVVGSSPSATSATSGDLRVRVPRAYLPHGVPRRDDRGRLEADRHGAGLSGLGQPRASGMVGPSLFHGPVKVTLSGFAISKGVCA